MMTSCGSEVSVRGWSWSCCYCWFWVVLSQLLWLPDADAAANSLSVLDSKLSSLYQKRRQEPYDVYEPGFAADPEGYEYRNAFQARHPAASLKPGPAGKSLNHDDDGYHTRTIPAVYHHDAGGYATQNAFHPHHSTKEHPRDEGYHTKTIGYATQNAFKPHYPTKEHYNKPVDDGYHTKSIGYATQNAYHPHHPTKEHPVDEGYNAKSIGFPLYQAYQHPYYAEPSGYETRNTAYHPYRSGDDHHHAADSPGKYLTDDGYHTRTADARWLPLYENYQQHRTDPGGYATQNVYRPYHRGIKVGGDKTGTAGYVEEVQNENTADYERIYSHDDDGGKNHDDGNYRRQHYYSNDDDQELSAASATTEYDVIYPADNRPTNVIYT